MYFVYSLDVNNYKLIVHSSFASYENTQQSLDKIVKNFITHEQGAKYATIWKSLDDFNNYSTIEKGYFLVKEDKNRIILYEKYEVLQKGYIYNSSQTENRKVKLYDIGEANYDISEKNNEQITPKVKDGIIRNIHYDGLVAELKKNKKFKARKID